MRDCDDRKCGRVCRRNVRALVPLWITRMSDTSYLDRREIPNPRAQLSKRPSPARVTIPGYFALVSENGVG